MRWLFRTAVIFLAISPWAASVSASDLRYLEDATLRSVFFIDPNEGWAVGDEGMILHTLDGGKSWLRQQNGLVTAQRVSLRSVQFLTPEVGWIAGREDLPYGMGSVGVVLFTRNGGLEWQQQLASTLPGLNQVRFVDVQNGFLLGDGAAQFPSGVFKTNDGGRSWEPVAGPRTTSWLAGDFYDDKTGILAGAWSRLATLRSDKFTTADPADRLSGRDITSLQILGRKTLAVAQGGLILTRVTQQSAWTPVQELKRAASDEAGKTNWPSEVLANLDFHSLHAVKERVWVVGRPGSVVLCSSDSGTTWSLTKTGQSLPLHGVFFFNEKLGWAVGDAGTILQSTDAGKTWAIQHQAGTRTAGLCLHARRQDAPVDTLTLLGAAEGHLLTSLCITAPDPASIAWGRAPTERRYAAAMRQAGALTGETLWHFPLPQHLENSDKKTILAHWNQSHDGRAADELMRQLVLTLRTWRPSVVFTEHPESKTALSAFLGEAVLEAVQRAANPKEFPEQIDELGLQTWQARKVYGSGAPKTVTVKQDNDEPNLRLRATVRDYAAAAHALLAGRYEALPAQRAYERLLVPGAKVTVERHWMEGLNMVVGETKRDVKDAGRSDEKLINTLLQRRGAIALAENLDDPERTLKLIPLALDKLPADHAAPAAFAIASRLAQRGQWYLAQEVYLYMVDRYPYHPLSGEAFRWLIRLNNSGEARRRHDLKHFAVTPPLNIAKKDGTQKNAIQRVGYEEAAPTQEPLVNRSDIRDWNKGSLELSKRLGGYGPVYAFDPATQFSLQPARRLFGNADGTRDWLKKFNTIVPAGVWHEAAQAELWLGNPAETPPRRAARARFTEVRPHLDGKFDDPCWQDTKPMVLDDAVGDSARENATDAMFTFDQEFLYIALRCRHPSGQGLAPVKPRPRDADVDSFDRVSILLDLDRDYATCYHLEVDQRGCVRDSCWSDRTWNPKWFVAVHSTDTAWQIEAAIPLSELTGERIGQQTAWAFNVVRILPGRGVQSWSQPADVRPCPEGMSLLLFQTGAAKTMQKAP